MKLELFIFGIAGFMLYNIYHDGKYSKVFVSYKKYYQMGIIAILAICLYLMIKRNPAQSKNMLLYTNNMIKYMPIDKSSMDMLTPIFDFTSKTNTSFMEGFNKGMNPDFQYNPVMASQQQRAVLSGSKATKRSVSETKKKYVASMQDWKCGQCNNKLSHTFEIDHKIRLEHGGGNDATNLVALCRECHGEKTAMENM
jgi:HNH endonuclease